MSQRPSEPARNWLLGPVVVERYLVVAAAEAASAGGEGPARAGRLAFLSRMVTRPQVQRASKQERNPNLMFFMTCGTGFATP
jgi:hypothetical protein